MFTADKRYYLNADKSRVVEEGDPEASSLLVGAGGELPMAEARTYGLIPEAKAVEAPPENKAVRRKETK